ncbi:PIN domain-containing protein [Candidatus Woesearchaeota archaeon]|nr:PIN domain-containing protein [Candidatus Woesearchaeota archaeon]
MKYLDTYILMEIAGGNKKFTKYIDEEFIISHETLAEFIWVLLRDKGEEIADKWGDKLKGYSKEAALYILIKAMKLRYKHKKQGFSFFDCVGYIFAREMNIPFVTEDKEFKEMKGVEFIQG